MPYETIVHADLWRELPRDEHEDARAALRGIARFDDVAHSPHVAALAGSRFDSSYRLRFGRYRFLFLLFSDEGALAFTTAFLKRRDGDYGPAIARHDERVRTYE